MKRQVVAVLIGSLFALPVFANNEIDASHGPLTVTTSKSRAQVGEELVAAKQSGNWMVNAELGTQSKLSAPAQFAGKRTGEVRAELEQAFRSGEMIVNAELGTTGTL